MKNITKWFSNLIDSDSSASSKRFALVLITFWAILMGTFYVIRQQFGGVESVTTVGLIEFALGSAITLAIGGTAAEAVKKKFQSKKESDHES